MEYKKWITFIKILLDLNIKFSIKKVYIVILFFNMKGFKMTKME